MNYYHQKPSTRALRRRNEPSLLAKGIERSVSNAIIGTKYSNGQFPSPRIQIQNKIVCLFGQPPENRQLTKWKCCPN